MMRLSFLFFLLLANFQIAKGQSYYLINHYQSDSSSYAELTRHHESIQQLEIAEQIMFFENIQDSIQVEIDQLLEAEKATGRKKSLRKFFEQLQENLEELQRLQQTNKQLFLELDSLQQQVFGAFYRGEIRTNAQYRQYRKKLKLRKKYVRYHANTYRIEKKRRSTFVGKENLNDFFATREWNNSLFSEVMNYMNKAIEDQGEQRQASMIANMQQLEIERKRQIDSLEEDANRRREQLEQQQISIAHQRYLIDSLNAIVQQKTESRKILTATILEKENSLKDIQYTLLSQTDELENVQLQLKKSSDRAAILTKKNLDLNSSLQQRQKEVLILEEKGKDQLLQNKLLQSNQIRLEDRQKELLQAKIKTDNRLKLLAAASTLGVLLLTFTATRMNKEKQKVTTAYSELEQTKNLLQRKTEELNLSHRELNHRIKNNLQQISSLIYLQEDEIEDEQARAAFSALQGRIDTIKIVHQKLYSKQQQQLTMVNMAEYIQDLVKYIVGRDATIHLSVPDIAIEMDHATDIGLIINELVTNASKYAFPIVDQPAIWVEATVKENTLFITVKDNGPGFPANFSLDQITSFGLTSIVEMFVHKSGKGNLKTYNEEGAVVQISMPFDLKTGKLVA